MGRHVKTGVDYFPHRVKHGETMFILESQYGNDGYAAWFKILEMLGGKEGHYLDCGNGKPTWEYIKARTLLSDEKLKSIIDLLSKLDAIDQELWNKKVIWSQHFVDGISEVYRKRSAEKPEKPRFCRENNNNRDENATNTPIPAPESTQSKVKKRKGKERKYISISATEIIPEKLKEYLPPLGQFQNVNLTKEEHQKLKDKFSEPEANRRIEILSEGIASKGYKYKSHYAAILQWARKDEQDGNKKARSAVDEGLARFLATEDEPGRD